MLRRTLQRRHADVRGAIVARRALRAAAAGAALVAIAVLAGVAGGGPGAATARLVALALALVAVLALSVRALLVELPRFDAWLEGVERARPDVRSWLRNALDLETRTPDGTSESLAAALVSEAGERLARTELDSLRPALAPRRPAFALAAAAAALLAFALVAPQQALRSWRTLWDPALAAPPVSLVVEPGSVRLAPGATLAIRASVRGTAAAPRLLGDGPSPAPVLETDADGARHWRFDLPPVTRARDYAVRVQRTTSERYAIALDGTPQPVSFTFEYRAPAYARLPVQTGSATRGDVAALRGSTARIEVTFDRDVESLRATLPGGRSAAWTAITPRRWRGELRVDGDGEWSLQAESPGGASRHAWRIAALADAPPVLTVATPRADLDLPAGSFVPFDVLAEDDLGVADVRLQWRKAASEAWRDVPLPAPAGQPREARVTSRWDASVLALLPGESGTFRFEARDNNAVSGASRAHSPEFHVRFPSLSDLYEKLDQQQETVAQSLQRVAQNARELQKSLDQLQRQAPRPGQQQQAPQFERAEEMRKALERQRELSKQVDAAAQQMQEHMADASEREAFRAELQQKLREMSELVRQIQSPEFKQALERMQQAIDRMDRSQMEQQLPKMQEMNREMLKDLERSLALLKALRDEERLDALAKRAEDLAKQQDQLNAEHQQQAGDRRTSDADRRDLAQRQQQAAERTEQLAQDAREAAQQTDNPDAQQGLQQAAEQMSQEAEAQQQQAAQQAQQGDSKQASQSGQKASESLRQSSQRMNASSAQAQAQRNSEQLAAMRRAAQDLVTLGQQAAQSLQSSSAQEAANRQADLSEGIARVADSLNALGQDMTSLSPALQEQLGRAMNQMSRAGREMQQGNRPGGQQAGQAAGQALADAVNSLRDTEAAMCNKPGSKPGQGMPGKSGQKMGRLQQQQADLNGRSKELSQRLGQASRLTPGDQAELRRLADQQQRLREELQSIQRDEEAKRELLGRLDQTARDMQAAEEQLRAGQLGDDLEQRQAQILSRMLDAQRSLHRREFDPQREAERGADVPRPSPAPLPEGLLRESDRVRLGLLKADADRYPAQYRALIERYLQRLNGTPK
ncbi:MAG: hypothetical protein U0704_03290 [Candidatus Eisenbacteria bacterium]